MLSYWTKVEVGWQTACLEAVLILLFNALCGFHGLLLTRDCDLLICFFLLACFVAFEGAFALE